LAAQVLAYAADKNAIANELLFGASDPDAGVRNNAIRALGVLASYAQKNPQAGIKIPAEPFISLINSPNWFDRNKGLSVLFPLSAARDPALLANLRNQSLTSLIEMARWKAEGHSLPAFFILGRVGGLSEDDIRQAWAQHDVARLLATPGLKNE